MCGIYGEFTFNSLIDPKLASKKLDLIKHRGPDGFGWEHGDYLSNSYILAHNPTKDASERLTANHQSNYFLGHRRLSIIDLSEKAFQPMENFNKQLSIVFNGEIYNYIELKKELETYGCRFNTDHSDTEVLLNAYSVWGEKCLTKLRGMFAFVIFDRRKKIIFFARDRIGKKPFYFEFNKDKFCFSSELSPLVRLNNTKRVVSKQALYYYLVFGYILHPQSIFEDINKLSPATYGVLNLSSKKLILNNYWDVNVSKKSTQTFNDSLQDVEECLHESVLLRLRSDVPVGAFISGGIDSTMMIKKIREIHQGKQDVFGADFPETNRSEKKYIEEAAARYDQRLNLSNIDLSHIGNIKDIISVFDEPFDGGSSIAVFDLFKKARSKNYKVILTGDGGDELFAGYERYQRFQRFLRIKSLLQFLYLPFGVRQNLTKFVFHPQNHKKIRSLLFPLIQDKVSSFIYMNSDFEIAKLLKNDFNDISLNDFDEINKISSITNEGNFSDVKTAQYFDLKTVLPGRMLYKIDRFSMSSGVEARAPLLDHRLAELAFSIPDKHNIDLQQTKKILKNILLKDFPQEFVYRRKQGFGNPFDNWFRNSDPNTIFGILMDRSSLIYNYLDYDSLLSFFPDFTHGYESWRTKQLWRLVVLGQYLENHRDIIKH